MTLAAIGDVGCVLLQSGVGDVWLTCALIIHSQPLGECQNDKKCLPSAKYVYCTVDSKHSGIVCRAYITLVIDFEE